MMQYYLRSSKGERGPFSVQELQQLVDRGKINGTTPVRTNGSESWVPLSELPPPPGYADSAQVEQQLPNVDFPAETPSKPFATVVPPVAAMATAKRRRGFRISTLFMVFGVLSIGFIPVWAFLFFLWFTALDTSRDKSMSFPNWVNANWFGVSAGLISAGLWISLSLFIRDFERE